MKIFIISIFFTLLNINTSFAEPDDYKLGKAAGHYICLVDILEKLSNSDCSIHVKDKYSTDRVKSDILCDIPMKYHEEFGAFFNDPDLKKRLDFNMSTITGQLEILRNNGMSRAESCITAYNYFKGYYEDAKKEWEEAKKNYK